MAYLAQVSYTGDGSTVGYSLPFTYIATTHIKAYIAGVETSAFTVSGSTVTFTTAPANAAVIKLERVTPTDARLVDFQDGSVLTESDLDKSADQNFFTVQEMSDSVQSKLGLNASSLWDADSKRIINVADPTSAQDAATKNYLESTWLSTSDKANLTTVAGISGNITTVAGISANVTAVAGDATDIGVVAGKATEIGRLGTADAVTDLNTLGTADVVTDMNVLATGANVTAMGLLGTSANVTAMGLLGTSAVVTNMGLLGTSAVVSDLSDVADNIAGVNSFADRYRVGSTNPASSLDEGDLFYNSSDNTLKYYNGSSWASITAGIGSMADDTSPQLGGDLDLNGNIIDFKPEEPMSNANTVGANTTTTLTTARNYMLVGPITVSSSYTWTVGGSGELRIL